MTGEKARRRSDLLGWLFAGQADLTAIARAAGLRGFGHAGTTASFPMRSIGIAYRGSISAPWARHRWRVPAASEAVAALTDRVLPSPFGRSNASAGKLSKKPSTSAAFTTSAYFAFMSNRLIA